MTPTKIKSLGIKKGHPFGKAFELLSQRADLNCRPLPYQGNALPLSYVGVKESERPGSNRRHSAWKADALPTELLSHFLESFHKSFLKVWGEQDSNLRS